VAARAPTQVRTEAPKPSPAAPTPSRAKVPTGPARRRAEAAEAALARATEARAAIDRLLADPELFAKDPARGARLGREREAAQAEVEAAEAEWLEAHEAYEAVRTSA
jgi:ATP-binding cassette subfamily F protein 3